MLFQSYFVLKSCIWLKKKKKQSSILIKPSQVKIKLKYKNVLLVKYLLKKKSSLYGIENI